MSRKVFCTLAGAFLSITTFCQVLSKGYGVVTNEDLEYARAPFDSTADAVVLFDHGEARFHYTTEGFVIRYERTRRVKILSDKGKDEANFELALYMSNKSRFEDLYLIEGVTHNFTEGKLLHKQLEKESIFKDQISDHTALYTVTFPEVRKGSILDLHYIVDSPYLFSMWDWDFQGDLPVVESTFTCKMVPFYEYVFLLQGRSNFDAYSSEDGGSRNTVNNVTYLEKIHHFTMQNIPAFRDEGYFTTRNDYLIKIVFQLAQYSNLSYGDRHEVITTWPKLCRELEDHEFFGKYIRKAEKQAEEFLAGIGLQKDLDASVKAIIDGFKARFAWDGSNSYMASRSPKEVYESRTGDAAELNLLLVAILRQAGLDARPVILSTRKHGKIRADYPFADAFNSVIIHVRQGQYGIYTDATSRYLPYDRIPERCINDFGLVQSDVNGDQVEWLNLTPGFVSSSAFTLTQDLNAETGDIDVGGAFRFTEYAAARSREELHETSHVEKMIVDNGILAPYDVRMSERDEVDKPFSLWFKGSVPSSTIGDKLLIQPFLDFSIENPFHQEARTYPVDFTYPAQWKYTSIIGVPEGYASETIPEPVQMDNPIGMLSYKVDQLGDKLRIVAQLEVKKAQYGPDEYPALRRFFEEATEKLTEPVVFEQSE